MSARTGETLIAPAAAKVAACGRTIAAERLAIAAFPLKVLADRRVATIAIGGFCGAGVTGARATITVLLIFVISVCLTAAFWSWKTGRVFTGAGEPPFAVTTMFLAKITAVTIAGHCPCAGVFPSLIGGSDPGRRQNLASNTALLSHGRTTPTDRNSKDM
jgi:hypothetical protein